MSLNNSNNNEDSIFVDDMQEIIEEVPHWILQWGIVLFFGLLLSIIGLSALIQYPDIVKTSLKVYSKNSPKPIVSKISGKIVNLLVKENTFVKLGEPLAYLESTANHIEMLKLENRLKALQKLINSNQNINILTLSINNTELGELQTSYQTFYLEYLTYISTINNGSLIKKKEYLEKDEIDLNKQKIQLENQKKLQERDFTLAEEDFLMHQKLYKDHAETSSELRQQESRFLAKKSPLIQTEGSILAASTIHSAKLKEILELNNTLLEERLKFLQALNSLISQTEDWMSKYILIASQNGKLSYVGIIQQNQVVKANDEIFYINSGNENFFGEMVIPQFSMGKVKEGQRVLIKFKSYPFEEYGMLSGKINYISEVPYRDSVFLSKVNIDKTYISDLKKRFQLKSGMMADAEIITQDATVFQRITRNLLKTINNH